MGILNLSSEPCLVTRDEGPDVVEVVTPATDSGYFVETRLAKPGFFARVAANPARDWVLLFLAIQCLVNVDGNTNARSRWASMAALAEDHSFRIDNYHEQTIDWAQTPDGHYYSNKAPGPALLGYPLFLLMDKISTLGAKNREERDRKRLEDRSAVLHALSVATQAIPYGLIVLGLIAALGRMGLPVRALHVAALALLFGNTGSLFMNTYCGHGMATTFVVALLLAWHKNRPFLVGLFFGLATLCDYGAALLLLPLLWVLWRRSGTRLRRFGRFVLGGVMPAAVFAAYHQYCFGSPLSLPNKFQNPAFVDIANVVPNLWGVLRLVPRAEVVADLLWSTQRGLLFTQPWILLSLLIVPFLFWHKSGWLPERRAFVRWTSVFGAFGLILLLGMNASFGGWHGGATPGPRYLAVAFPALALAMAGIYARASEFWRQALVVTLVVSVVLFVLFYSTAELLAQPSDPLSPFYFNLLVGGQGKNLSRCLFIVLGFAWAGWRAVQGVRRETGAEHLLSEGAVG
jgi:hypothetical protein